MLTAIDSINLKELSEIYDTVPSFISVYLTVKKKLDLKFVDRRAEACREALRESKELLDIFESNMQKIYKYLEDHLPVKGERAVAIFCSNKNDFFRNYALPVAVDNALIVDTSPYVRPLARLRDEWETFGIILLDSRHAKMYVVSAGLVKDAKRLSADIMGKHSKGGWSQMRFQRLRREAIHRFYRLIIDDLETFLSSYEDLHKLILAGPGEAKHRFNALLPPLLREKVIDIIDMSIDAPEHELLTATSERVAMDERNESAKAVEYLRAGILKDGAVVYGIPQTVEAVRNGQVELLLVSKDYKVRGWLCEWCQCVEKGTGSGRCPYCGNVVTTVDVIEEIIEFAERSGSKLEFVDDSKFLEALGGVGGFLRFR